MSSTLETLIVAAAITSPEPEPIDRLLDDVEREPERWDGAS